MAKDYIQHNRSIFLFGRNIPSDVKDAFLNFSVKMALSNRKIFLLEGLTPMPILEELAHLDDTQRAVFLYKRIIPGEILSPTPFPRRLVEKDFSHKEILKDSDIGRKIPNAIQDMYASPLIKMLEDGDSFFYYPDPFKIYQACVRYLQTKKIVFTRVYSLENPSFIREMLEL